MKNRCKIAFEGLNINRLLGYLTKQNIPVFSVRREGKQCVIEVPYRRSKQTIAILRERCYNILDIEYIGLSKGAKFVQKHFVLPIVCAITALALTISSQFCFVIRVNGDFESSCVTAALSNVGVKVGVNLHTLNLKSVQNALANELNADYVSVVRRGSVLYVDAAAKKEISPPIDLSVKRNLVATCSGTVKSLVCELGTPAVKVGDIVNEGDVLIEGCRTFNDGTSCDVYALGRVVLTVSSDGFAPFDGTKEVFVETGETFCSVGVVLFGKEYSRKCPFENYNLSAESTSLFPLNIEIRKNTYRETVKRRVAATIEECMQLLRQQAYADALSRSDFEVTTEEYVVRPDGVAIKLYGEVQVE